MTLERVFRNSVAELITTNAVKLPVKVKREMHDHFWPVISKRLNGWISTKLHSKRKSTPDGMFDLMPSQSDLDCLVSDVINVDSFEASFEVVKSWLVVRLTNQLKEVQASFDGELRDNLNCCIAQAVEDIPVNVQYNEQDTKEYRLAVVTALDHCIADTVSWFSIPEQEAQGAFALSEAIEVAKQICDVNTNDFVLIFDDMDEVSADLRKPALYTFVDAFANARKYAPNQRVRVSRYGDELMFSNLVAANLDFTTWDRSVDADNHDALFSEGDSGLAKIAAGMYALSGKAVSVRAIKKKMGFHLILPLEGLIRI